MRQLQHQAARASQIIAAISLTLVLVRCGGTQSTGTSNDQPSSPTPSAHYGLPIDWSSHYLVATGPDQAFAMRDPRQVYNQVRRNAAVENALQREAAPHQQQVHVDWAVSLENGFVPQNQYPAKYQFNVGAEDCNNDYVVYALTVNAGTQANLVGINNLYTSATPTPCNAGSPWVAFAYNTVTQPSGQIGTSPSLSVDGTKVAFVESTTAPAASYFHVLALPSPIPVPPAQTGTVLLPVTPTSCTTPTTPSCMTTLQISSATDTLSSVWIDYNSDTAYVGTDDGKLYKINPVFGGGAPALVNDPTNWPVTVVTQGTSTVVTDPIVDVDSGRIFLGDENGFLYAVNLSGPAQAAAASVEIGWIDHGPGTGVVDPPIVVNDISNPTTNQVFAFTGCSQVLGVGGAITQLPANFDSFTLATNANTVNLGSGTGIGDCTTSNVHAGTFDNAFWLDGSASGHIIACGFVNAGGIPSDPEMYEFAFDGVTHDVTSLGTNSWVIDSTPGDECSPLSEFFDGTTDRMFFGVGSSDGFVESSDLSTFPAPDCTDAPTSTCVQTPSALGGTSGIIIDNQLFGANGGANIYFGTLAPGSVNGQSCQVIGGTANPYCAVQLTQSALQ